VAQQALLRTALSWASQSSAGAYLLEAHGTGTSLGDPIEARAMVAVRDEPGRLIAMGCKANFGHTEPAAGLTGVLKLSTAMLHDNVAPNSQLRTINPHVKSAMHEGQLSSLPVHLARASEHCPGGVSSFGLNGTIAHVVLCRAGDDEEAATVLPPLVYRRRSFPWRDTPHPFVQRAIPSSDGTIVFRSPTAGALHALVVNHVVQGRVIFPGAGYLEVARAAGATALHDVYFLQPLAAEATGLLIECALSNARFEVRASETEAFEDATVHCSGTAALDAVWQQAEHASLRTRSRAADVGALYDGFDAVGLQYGPGYRTLINVWGGASDALARLRARLTHDGTQVHPASLDDALCTSAAMPTSSDGGGTRLPFAVDDALLQGAPGELWAVRSRNLQALSTAPYA
jgi:acyl transferase domain-containing protein